MIRIVVREQDRTGAVHCGGISDTSVRTFDIDAPELEAYLRAQREPDHNYVTREVVGAECLPPLPGLHGRDDG